jgi:hypothetical protein
MPYRNSSALLPTQTRMNPASPETADYYEKDQFAYVVEKLDWAGQPSKTYRVLTSFGDLGEAWKIGTSHEIHHDQTFRNLGFFKVVGTHDYKTGTKAGEVPDKKLAHWVFK